MAVHLHCNLSLGEEVGYERLMNKIVKSMGWMLGWISLPFTAILSVGTGYLHGRESSLHCNVSLGEEVGHSGNLHLLPRLG